MSRKDLVNVTFTNLKGPLSKTFKILKVKFGAVFQDSPDVSQLHVMDPVNNKPYGDGEGRLGLNIYICHGSICTIK